MLIFASFTFIASIFFLFGVFVLCDMGLTNSPFWDVVVKISCALVILSGSVVLVDGVVHLVGNLLR